MKKRSYKLCRGGRVGIDKAVEDKQSGYFDFWRAKTFSDKCKAAFKFFKGNKVLTGSYNLSALGIEFIDECRQNPNTYKPLLKLIEG